MNFVKKLKKITKKKEKVKRTLHVNKIERQHEKMVVAKEEMKRKMQVSHLGFLNPQPFQVYISILFSRL